MLLLPVLLATGVIGVRRVSLQAIVFALVILLFVLLHLRSLRLLRVPLQRILAGQLLAAAAASASHVPLP
jgi:hypothetical protein